MNNYKVCAVLWEDHMYIDREKMIDNPDNIVLTTLSIGILYKKTRKAIVLVNSIEAYEDKDDVCYTVILRSTIQSIQEYGDIELAKLRE